MDPSYFQSFCKLYVEELEKFKQYTIKIIQMPITPTEKFEINPLTSIQQLVKQQLSPGSVQ